MGRLTSTFALLLLVPSLTFGATRTAAAAEIDHVRVGTQFGLNYLPLAILEHERLWQKHAAALGVPLQVEYARLGGGATLNDALLSGAIQLAAGGTAPMLLLWDRTGGEGNVAAFAGLNQATNDFLCNRPDVRTLADLTPQDRIAVPAVKSSIQAVMLMALAEKTFGEGQSHRLDALTVTMQHPDALTALITRSGQITAYISSSPYQELALRQPGIHKLADNVDAFGGPATLTVVYGKRRFAADNPLVTQALYRALDEAFETVAMRREDAIDAYRAVTHDGVDRDLMRQILSGQDFVFAVEPARTRAIAQAMHRFGLLRREPQHWTEYFVQPMHARAGS